MPVSTIRLRSNSALPPLPHTLALPESDTAFKNAGGGGRVVLEMTWRGKHTGPMQSPKGEIPATGKSIEMRACQIVEVEGGKAKSMRHYFDMMTMMQQLGLVG